MIGFSFNKQLAITLSMIGAMIYTGVNILGVNLVPVVVGMKASEIENGGSYFTARVVGIKLRHCLYQSQQPFIREDNQAEWSEDAYFQYIKDRTPKSSKPIGRHDFGFWQWNSYGNVQIEAVKLITQHDCGGRTVFTTVGPFTKQEIK